MRPRLSQLHQSEATDGQMAAWDDALGGWVPVDPPAVPTVASDLTTAWIPLVTTIGGVPQLVFDAFDDLVLTEVPV